MSSVYHQAICEGNFGQEQKEDDQLNTAEGRCTRLRVKTSKATRPYLCPTFQFGEAYCTITWSAEAKHVTS